jgi:hypothetical protein
MRSKFFPTSIDSERTATIYTAYFFFSSNLTAGPVWGYGAFVKDFLKLDTDHWEGNAGCRRGDCNGIYGMS